MKKIPLSQGKFASVDDDAFDRLNQFKWHTYKNRNTWYAVRDQRLTKNCRFQLRMHSFIIGSPMPGFDIDHIDGDGLNNQRDNLRIISKRENQSNRYYHRNGTKMIGAHYDKRRGLWYSRIYHNGSTEWIGYFDNQKEAAEAYQETLKSLLVK